MLQLKDAKLKKKIVVPFFVENMLTLWSIILCISSDLCWPKEVKTAILQ